MVNHGSKEVMILTCPQDGAEVCKLVSPYLSNQLKDIIPKENICLYRNDGLRIFKNMTGPEIK